MKDVKKLELAIKKESTYEEILEESERIDQYINKKIREAL